VVIALQIAWFMGRADRISAMVGVSPLCYSFALDQWGWETAGSWDRQRGAGNLGHERRGASDERGAVRRGSRGSGTRRTGRIHYRFLRQAREAHRKGELATAELAYRHVLQIEPDNADALDLLGMLAAQTGHLPQALALLDRRRRALAARSADCAGSHWTWLRASPAA
jgi:hypothetical protein